MKAPNDPLGRDIGEALWPERYSVERLQAIKKAVGSFVWAAMFQQDPDEEEGNVVKGHWFQKRLWHPRDESHTDCANCLPEKFDRALHSWDMTFKSLTESKSGDPDYVVGGYWGLVGTNVYLLDVVRGQYGFNETLSLVRAFAKKHPVTEILIEDKANGPAIMNVLRSEIPGIVSYEPEGTKLARLIAQCPRMEAGNMWIPEEAEWLPEYIKELLRYPKVKHDDQVDMTSQALERLLGGNQFVFVVG